MFWIYVLRNVYTFLKENKVNHFNYISFTIHSSFYLRHCNSHILLCIEKLWKNTSYLLTILSSTKLSSLLQIHWKKVNFRLNKTWWRSFGGRFWGRRVINTNTHNPLQNQNWARLYTHCIWSFAWIIAWIRRMWIWTMKSTVVVWIFLWRVTGPCKETKTKVNYKLYFMFNFNCFLSYYRLLCIPKIILHKHLEYIHIHTSYL